MKRRPFESSPMVSTEPKVTSPKEFAELIRSDGERWAAVIKKVGLEPQ